MKEPAARGVQTALRAISILEEFSETSPSMTLSEIAERVELSVPTTYRLLKALQSRDLLVMEPDSRRYSLGYGIMSLARVITHRDDLVAVAAPGLERIRNETAETVSLQTVVGDRRVAVAELVSPHPIRMASGIGTPYHLARGSAGKAMLAFMSERDVARHAAETDHPDELIAELHRIRKAGYATSFGEVVPGAYAIAAPILNSSGGVTGAINITGPSDRFTAAQVEAAVPLLIEVANQVTRLLGGHPPLVN